jgi:hypothetical protein
MAVDAPPPPPPPPPCLSPPLHHLSRPRRRSPPSLHRFLLVISPRFSTSFHPPGRFSPFVVIAVFILPSLHPRSSSSSSAFLLVNPPPPHRLSSSSTLLLPIDSPPPLGACCRWIRRPAMCCHCRSAIALVATVVVVSLLSLRGDCPSLSSIRRRWVLVAGLASHLLWFPNILRR